MRVAADEDECAHEASVVTGFDARQDGSGPGAHHAAMPSMASRTRRKKRRPDRSGAAAAASRNPEELRAASPAQLGPDAEARRYRPSEEDASVEDPLGDWPGDD